MKKFIISTILMVVVLNSTLAISAKQISKELDHDGTLYMVAKYKVTIENFNTYISTLAQSILASQVPEKSRNRMAAKMELTSLALTLLGVDKDFVLGASSIENPEKILNYPMFRNKIILADSSKDVQGALWSFLNPKAQDLSTAMDNLPATTIFALNLDINTSAIFDRLTLLEKTLNPKRQKPLFNKNMQKALDNAKGKLEVTVMELNTKNPLNKKYPWGVKVSIDDPEKYMYNALASSFNFPMVGNKLILRPLPGEKNRQNAPRLVHKNSKTILYSSAETQRIYENPYPILKNEYNYNIVTKNLPHQGAGFIFTNIKLKNFNNLILNFLKINTLPPPTPMTMMVIQNRGDNIKITANSSWDLNTTLLQGALQFYRNALSRAIVKANTPQIPPKPQAPNLSLKKLEELSKKIQALRAQKQLSSAQLEEKIAKLVANTKDYKFIFYGIPADKEDSDLPIVSDAPTNHKDSFNVLLNDGRIESFSLKKLDSCRRLISFLHSHFRYSEKEFMRLIKRAMAVDKQQQ